MAPAVKSLSQTQSTQKKSNTSSKTKTVRLANDDPSSAGTSKSRRIDPLTAFSRNLVSSTPILTPPSQNLKGKGKGKGKAVAGASSSAIDDTDDFLWIDKYEPTTEAQLAVHVRKVEDVRRWITEAFEGGPSGKLTKYRRILALTGPSGTGKTTTIRVLARELGFEILEWRNSIGETSSMPFIDGGYLYQDEFQPDVDTDYESLFTKFEAFLTRASTCQNIFPDSSLSTKSSGTTNRRIILLEDLPNILHAKTQTRFHEALNSLVSSSPSSPPVPVIVVISDAGTRGEASDELRADGGIFGKDKSQVVDVRTVLSRELLKGPYVTEISFNPIAVTLLRKALQALISTHFSSSSASNTIAPSKEILEIIVESANGDIRSAIMALQFACVAQIPGGKKNPKAGNSLLLEAVTRREQSLALFHLLGKVLYNKRKKDPSSSSASAKDIQKERNIDASLKDPVKLPSHLEHHNRRTSRVDADVLYADSPIETSLFSLYIHQNYTQFCNELEESEGIADWLSWVDSSGGDAWYLANPHQFHLLALGTLHSLPSPVPRRSQKYYKPEFFSFLQKEKEASDAVRATRDWMAETQTMNDGRKACGWTRKDVTLELGGVLKALGSGPRGTFIPPHTHKLFSRMEFIRTGSDVHAQELSEGDEVLPSQAFNNGDFDDSNSPSLTKEEKGGWLESDDIEDCD